MGKGIGFSEVDQSKIAIVTMELGRNIILHAMGKGKIRVTRVTQPRPGIAVVAEDKGPGILNIEDALERSQRSRKGLGHGLGAVKRLMDELAIETRIGEGTTITAKKWISPTLNQPGVPQNQQTDAK